MQVLFRQKLPSPSQHGFVLTRDDAGSRNHGDQTLGMIMNCVAHEIATAKSVFLSFKEMTCIAGVSTNFK